MKIIHEVRDWETELKVSELPDNGIKLVSGVTGTPMSVRVNLSYEEGFELMESLYIHYHGARP